MTLAGYRRFYLYAALTVAVAAVAVGVVNALSYALRLAGIGGPPAPDEGRNVVSYLVAVVVVAVPVGAAHLYFIRRSLSDRAERESGARHFFLAGWSAAGLLVAAFGTQTTAQVIVARMRIYAAGRETDFALPLSIALVAAVIALAGWWWRRRTPSAPRWEIVWGYIAVVGALFGVLGMLSSLADSLAALAYGRAFPADVREASWSSGTGLVIYLVAWVLALWWVRPFRTSRARLAYLLAAYALGIFVLAVAIQAELVVIDRGVRGLAGSFELSGPWPGIVTGAFLAAAHLALLRADRRAGGRSAEIIDRLVVGIPAFAGLAALAIATIQWGNWLVDQVTKGYTDSARDQIASAAATTLCGLVLYPLPWRRFVQLTRDEPYAPERRFWLYTVICISLVGLVIFASIAVFQVVTMLLGDLTRSVRDALDPAGTALVAAFIFVAHLLLLRRDARAPRPRAAVPPPAEPDPLAAILERVARGELAPGEAATLVRRLFL